MFEPDLRYARTTAVMWRNVLIALVFVGCSSNDAARTAPSGPDAGGPGGFADAGGGGGFADARPTGGTVDAGGVPPCTVPGRTIVTDIDATLTMGDNEFLSQLTTGSEPTSRAGGAAMITAYAARGYYILYLTSRPESATIITSGESVPDATLRWLTENGYPVDPARTKVQLAPGLVFGASSANYKGGALTDMVTEGFVFDYAYGNAASDIDAYEQAGIDKAVTFIIGPEGGTKGTVAIDGDGWEAHAAAQLPGVARVCR